MICLFDIDGTILNSGGAGQHAMEQALLEVFGVTGPYQDIKAAGRTDKAITSDLFAHHKLDNGAETHQKFMEAYLRILPNSLETQDGRVLPGIVEILNELSSREIPLGLLTGNFEVAAYQKLNHFKLRHHFAFGGYGDHHHDRDDVARVAYKASVAHLKREVAPETVWVLGDTPDDVKCGRAIGAKVIAVATGMFSADVLEECQPDHLFEDFGDLDKVLSTLLN